MATTLYESLGVNPSLTTELRKQLHQFRGTTPPNNKTLNEIAERESKHHLVDLAGREILVIETGVYKPGPVHPECLLTFCKNNSTGYFDIVKLIEFEQKVLMSKIADMKNSPDKSILVGKDGKTIISIDGKFDEIGKTVEQVLAEQQEKSKDDNILGTNIIAKAQKTVKIKTDTTTKKTTSFKKSKAVVETEDEDEILSVIKNTVSGDEPKKPKKVVVAVHKTASQLKVRKTEAETERPSSDKDPAIEKVVELLNNMEISFDDDEKYPDEEVEQQNNTAAGEKVDEEQPADNNEQEEDSELVVDEETDLDTAQLSNDNYSDYIRNIFLSFDRQTFNSLLPSDNSYITCIKQNCLDLNLADFKLIVERLCFLEWSNYIMRETNGEVKRVTGSFVIDTGILKFSGNTMLILINVVDNMIESIVLDARLRDLSKAKLTRKDAVNEYKKYATYIKNNPLTRQSVDLDSTRWKQHILVERKDKLGLLTTSSQIALVNLVLDSVNRAIALEERGINVKRFVRGGVNEVSVAIPIMQKNALQPTRSALILTSGLDGIWDLKTVENLEHLRQNVLAYNLYDMPCWLYR